MNDNTFVLITACRNERNYIEGLIETVSNQSLCPFRWVIVDDHSTDGTYEIAFQAASQFPFVEIIRSDKTRVRDFASQVYAQQEGYRHLEHQSFDFVGFLDADIRFDKDYYERLIHRFKCDSTLGISGGLVQEAKGRNRNIRRHSLSHHVAGGVQLFRRRCYDDIGGYLPIPLGGMDTVAEVKASMHGWKVQSFGDQVAIHLRPVGNALGNSFTPAFRQGEKAYILGYDPLYFTASVVHRTLSHPPVIGACLQLFGFASSTLRRKSRPVSAEFVQFLRRSQRKRMLTFLGFNRPQPSRTHSAS